MLRVYICNDGYFRFLSIIQGFFHKYFQVGSVSKYVVALATQGIFNFF